ncbi:MAG: S1 RNA-binding domain-containing protein [Chloroflexi bacterium]|nr:S1 RNA-binding domain-containing protein [Chloroflexota bacterium]
MSEVIEETLVESTPEEIVPQSINDLKPKMNLTGTVTRLELYGAFIDLGVGTNALIHISQLGQEHVNRVSDVLTVGDEVTVWVDKVDPERKQIMVTMIEPLAVDWSDLKRGNVYTGTITRLESYGVFVNIGAEREGLVHISELSHDYVKHPSEVVSIGDEVEVQVLNFSKRKRRIDLSMKSLMEKPESENSYASSKEVFEFAEEEEDEGDVPTAMELALRQALGNDMPASRSKKSNKKRRRREKRRAQQEEILNRTLQVQQN